MDTPPRLSRALLSSLATADRSGLDAPPQTEVALPEKIVQFGTGAFLRGFAEYFVDEANRRGEFNGSIVAVASTGSSRDAIVNEQGGLFTLAIQGIEAGAARQQYRIVGSLSRAVSARDDWQAVLALAGEPTVEIVISNTTEVGIVLDSTDRYDASPPRSFPGKLTRFLAERANVFDYDPRRGVVVLPCELIDQNGTELYGIVSELARLWHLDTRFTEWLERAVIFPNTLVDRIVSGTPPPEEAARIEAQLGYRDGLMTGCETYALFAIEGDAALRTRLGFAGADPRIVVVPDIGPYRQRKVRVLNGGHTISVPIALLSELNTVSGMMADGRVGPFLRRAVFDEIVPSLNVPGAEEFARQVMDRFANPYIRHALTDITLYQTTKMRVRVVPSIVAFHQRTGRTPLALALGFAAFIELLRRQEQTERRTVGLNLPADPQGETIRAAWRTIDLQSDADVTDLGTAICADISLWETDLTQVNGFAEAVCQALVRIIRSGVRATLDVYLSKDAAIP